MLLQVVNICSDRKSKMIVTFIIKLEVAEHFLFYFSIFRAMKNGSDRQKLTPIDSSAFTILNGLKVYQSRLYRMTLGMY